MKFLRILLLVTFVSCLYSGHVNGQPQGTPVQHGQKAINPTGFIEEKGQFKMFENLRFQGYGNNMFIYLLTDRVVFISREVTYVENEKSREAAAKGDENLSKKLSAVTTARRFDLVFENCDPKAEVQGEGQNSTQVDYYLAHCPDGILNVPSFQKVRYRNLYPNIDLVFAFEGNTLKYEFEVRSGGKPSDIDLRWDGVNKLRHNEKGELQFSIGSFDFTDKPPVSLSGKSTIATDYLLEGNHVKFDVSDYNHTETLVIDPALSWASSLEYNGYGSWGGLVTNSIGDFYVVDWEWNPGDAAMANYLSSAGSISLNSLDNSNNDIVISKFSKNGGLLWVCRYGGTGDDDVNGGVALDDNGNLFIAGTSQKEFSSTSGDFPLQTWAGAFNQAWDGSSSTGTRGYLLKFLSNNTRQWATYLDKGANLEVFDIACGQNNSIYMTGTSGGSPTYSTGIPSGTGYLGTLNGTSTSHSFILEFNNSGALYWATWLPGIAASTNMGRASELSVDKITGDIYITGDDMWSFSTPFSTAFITASYTNKGNSDLFCMKFNSSNQPVPSFGKYIGGAGFDKINIGAANGDTEVDAAGNLYACGHTYSADFPLVNPGNCAYYDGVIDDGTGITANVANIQDGYLFKLSPAGVMTYSTFFGGANYTSMKRLAKDSHNNLWICGEQVSAGLAPMSHADYFNQGITGSSNNFMLAQLGSNDNLEWLSYYGFSGYSGYNGLDIWEPATDSIHIDLTGNFNIVSNTGGGYQFVSASSCTGAAQFKHLLTSYSPFTISGATTLCATGTTTWTATMAGGTWSSSNTFAANIDASTGVVTGVSGGSTNISYSLMVMGCLYTQTATLTVTPAASIATVTGTSPLCISGTATYTANGTVLGGGTGAWSSDNNLVANVDASGLVTAVGAGTCNIIYTITGGCGGTVSQQQSLTVSTALTASVAVSASANPICEGTSVTFTAAPTNGGTPSYQWYLNGNPVGSNSSSYANSSLTNSSQIYCVMTSTASCVSGSPATSNTVTMTVNSLSVAPVSITATANPACSGDPTTLTIQGGSLGTGASWMWYTGSCGGTSAGTGASLSLTPAVGDTYYALAQGTCNTTSCVSITVTITPQADATIVSTGPYCTAEMAVALAAADAGGTWTGDGIINASSGLFDPSVAGLGNHQIIYTLSGPCGDIDTAIIVVVSTMDASISPAGPYCENVASANLTAASPGGSWSGTGITNAAAGTFDPAVAGEGIHTIIYTITGACGNSDTIPVTVNPAPSASATCTAESCVGAADGTAQAVATGGTAPFAYLWSGTHTTANLSGLAPGTYTVVITDANGCADSKTVNVAAATISCENTPPAIYLPNVFSPNGDGNNDMLYVRGQGIESMKLEIYNRWGEKVFESSSLQDGWNGEYKGKKLDNGVFVYHLTALFNNGEEYDNKGNITLIK